MNIILTCCDILINLITKNTATTTAASQTYSYCCCYCYYFTFFLNLTSLSRTFHDLNDSQHAID